MPGLFRIAEGAIDLREAIDAVAGPDRGAIATFSGIVRDHHGGRKVLRLDYQAYPEMAEQVLREIGREVGERFGTPHIAILHRVGVLEIGEASVVIAVAAAHRRDALAACAYAIDRLKVVAPIWKKEYYEGGSGWIEGADDPPADP
jgi:molybdopterin synthase catalytic subunit